MSILCIISLKFWQKIEGRQVHFHFRGVLFKILAYLVGFIFTIFSTCTWTLKMWYIFLAWSCSKIFNFIFPDFLKTFHLAARWAPSRWRTLTLVRTPSSSSGCWRTQTRSTSSSMTHQKVDPQYSTAKGSLTTSWIEGNISCCWGLNLNLWGRMYWLWFRYLSFFVCLFHNIFQTIRIYLPLVAGK